MESRKAGMRHTLSLSLASLALLFLMPLDPALAQVPLKKKIMENCPEALVEIQQLSRDDRRQFIPYLRLVLRLQTAQIEDFGAQLKSHEHESKAAGAPFFDLDNAEIWRSFQPGREIKAKRCALEALLLIIPDSLDTVPDMIEVLTDPLVPQDVKDLAESAIRFITVQAAADPTLILSDDFLQRSAQLFRKDDTFFVENVFLELGDKTLQFLLDYFPGSDPKVRDVIKRILLKIDPAGSQLRPAMENLLLSGDESVRIDAIDVLSKLPEEYANSFPAIAKILKDLSPVVREKALASLLVMTRDSSRNAEIVCDKECFQSLLSFLQGSEKKSRDDMTRILVAILPQVEEGERALLALYPAADADLKARILFIFGQSRKRCDECFRIMSTELQSPESRVQLAAIRALGRLKDRTDEVSAKFLRLLKSNSTLADVGRRQHVIFQIADALANLRPTLGTGGMIPYFVEALSAPEVWPNQDDLGLESYEDGNPVARALIAIGPDSVPALIKAFNNQDPIVRKRISYVLGRIRPIRPPAIEALASHLKDGDSRVRAEVRNSLELIGAPVVPYITKLLKKSPNDVRLAIAEILGSIGKGTPESEALIVSAIGSAACEERPKLAAHIELAAPEERTKVAHALISCLYNQVTAGNEIIPALGRLEPLPEDSRAEILGLLKLSKIDRGVEFQILERAKKLELPVDPVIERLGTLLDEGEDPIKFRAISILGSFGSAAKVMVPKLQTIVEEKKKEALLRDEAAVALASIERSSIDLTSFFVAEFDSDRALWAGKAIHQLDTEIATPLLIEVLDKVKKERKILVIRTIGDLAKSTTQDPVPSLIPYLENESTEIQYQATIALFRHNPTLSELVPAFRRQLVRRDAPRLFNEGLGAELVPILEEILAKPESRVESYNAKQLLEQVKKEKAKEALVQ